MPQLDENFVTVLSIVEFPEDIFDMFFVVDERNDYENDDESSGDESPEIIPDSSECEESDIKYY